MALSVIHIIGIFLIGIAVGLFFSKYVRHEGFLGWTPSDQSCDNCGKPSPCDCPHPKPHPGSHPGASHPGASHPACPECKQPNMSNYVLKSSIPPCPAVPDLSNYILKSECPPVPDLSNYVLKSSIPKQTPVILDCSKCQKAKGECPPCPRARCPEVTCPPAAKCPTCPPCPRASCPPAKVTCKAEGDGSDSLIRPYLAPMSYRGFGME